MAIGDDALAAGMALVNGAAANSAPAIDDYINQTRDYIAQRTATVTTVAKGGTGATTASAARTNLDVPSNADMATKLTRSNTDYNADFASRDSAIASKFDKSGGTVSGNITTTGYVDVGGSLSSPYARANGVASWLAVGVNPSGVFGFQSSTARVKKEIKSWSPDLQAVLALQLVTFRYKAAAWDGEGESPIQVGLIAERLDEIGLDWLVIYDGEGLPAGIHYEKIALALLPVIQDHETRLAALEQGV